MTNRILMVLTSHDRMGDTGDKTGLWLEEFAAPYYALRDAGAEVTLVSPRGGATPVDPNSLSDDAATDATRRYHDDADAQDALGAAGRLADAQARDFDAIFYPGGHGPLWDLADDPDSRALVEAFWSQGKPVAAVCHAPIVLKDALAGQGRRIVHGRSVTGFSNAEEEMMGLTDVVPYLVEDELKAAGGDYRKAEAPLDAFVTVDGLLITGQNPASSAGAAQALLHALDMARAA